MISVVIETLNDEEALAHTLASLVGGSVEGLVREVIICDLGSTDQTQKVADIAGCNWLATGGVAAAARQARGEWLLLLEPGAVMAEGWIEPAAVHCARATMAANFTNRQQRPLFSRVLRRNRALERGFLVRKGQAAALAQNRPNAEAIARGVAVKQLSAGIYPAGL